MYGDCSCYDCAANLCDAICDGMGFVDKRIAFTRSLRSETGDKMPGWPSEERYEVIKTVFGDEVSCYMDGRFGIKKWNKVLHTRLSSISKDKTRKCYLVSKRRRCYSARV